ncbi:MAG: zinc ribbon domain-containing protein [Eubacterium sp.]|nr:zinc ribbon domain-containing protein [Eubacterium sp.]
MSKCIYCGTELEEGAKFCAACGKKQEPVQQPQGAGQAANAGMQQSYGQQANYAQQAYSQPQQSYSSQGVPASQMGYGQQQYQASQQQYQASQQQYSQQAYGQQGYQQVQGYNAQQYGQAQGYGYNQQGYPGYGYGGSGKAKKAVAGVVNAKLSFKQILCIIAAMFIIFSPFLNFASIHAKVGTSFVGNKGLTAGNNNGNNGNVNIYNLDYDDIFDDDNLVNDIKLKATVGFNLFELSKLSGSVRSVINSQNAVSIDLVKSLYDQADAMRDNIKSTINSRVSGMGYFNDGVIDEAFGTAHLIIWGRFPLLVLPYVIMLGGIALIAGTYLRKKIVSYIGCGAVLVSLFWLMLVSGHFFSMAGIGVLVMLAGSVTGIVATVLDK